MFKIFYGALLITILAINTSFSMEEELPDKSNIIAELEAIQQEDGILVRVPELSLEARVAKLEGKQKAIIRTVSILASNSDSEDEDEEISDTANPHSNSNTTTKNEIKTRCILKSTDFYLGTCVAFLVAYFAHRFWTYKDEEQNSTD